MQPHSRLLQYPDEQPKVAQSVLASFLIHFGTASLVCLIAYLLHIASLKQLMVDKSSEAQSGPAPEQQIELLLRPDTVPPPPTDHVEFAIEKVKPPPQDIPPPPIPPPPKPQPTPPPPTAKPKKPVVTKPARFTAPDAVGAGASNASAQLVVGSGDFPRPTYPYQAQMAHQTGTVQVFVQFDGSGGVASVEVRGSSGSVILDAWTRTFILSKWKSPSFAGRSATVPIVYVMR